MGAAGQMTEAMPDKIDGRVGEGGLNTKEVKTD